MAAFVSLAVFAAGSGAQTVQVTGRVLEKVNLDPVPGALVKWSGSNLSTTTDSLGRFTLSGSPSAVNGSFRLETPTLREGFLRVAAAPNARATLTAYDTRGNQVGFRQFTFSGSGVGEIPLWPEVPGTFFGFVVLRCEGQAYRFRVLHHRGPIPQGEAAFAAALGKTAVQGQVDVSMTGLIGVSVPVNSSPQDLGDIVLDYPARTKIGVGAKTPYGAVVLFDGSHGPAAAAQELNAKWKPWWRFNVTGHPPTTQITFKIAKDPQFPSDTNRVALRTCCETVPGNWGYNDLQALAVHGDAQIHVEWMPMGKYDSAATENPDTSSTCNENDDTQNCFFNSGFFVQSRYEIQIQAIPLALTTLTDHSCGGIAHDFAPLSNQAKINGVWQAYDATFRTARYAGTTSTANGYMTVWWNGVQTHLNRMVTRALSAGVAAHSGEDVNDTLYGVKLQDELGDVRFRNIWMKKLKIDSTGTNFGY
jgi:hypothetical protein